MTIPTPSEGYDGQRGSIRPRGPHFSFLLPQTQRSRPSLLPQNAESRLSLCVPQTEMCMFPGRQFPRAYLVPDQHRSHVEARSIAIRNPVFVYFNELADALQQLLLVKVLGGFHRSQGSRFSPPPSALSPRTDWPLTGRQRRRAERSILSMLSQGRKRRTCWSPPLYAFKPSKSCRKGGERC